MIDGSMTEQAYEKAYRDIEIQHQQLITKYTKLKAIVWVFVAALKAAVDEEPSLSP
jgi:hypothetical protein